MVRVPGWFGPRADRYRQVLHTGGNGFFVTHLPGEAQGVKMELVCCTILSLEIGDSA